MITPSQPQPSASSKVSPDSIADRAASPVIQEVARKHLPSEKASSPALTGRVVRLSPLESLLQTWKAKGTEEQKEQLQSAWDALNIPEGDKLVSWLSCLPVDSASVPALLSLLQALLPLSIEEKKLFVEDLLITRELSPSMITRLQDISDPALRNQTAIYIRRYGKEAAAPSELQIADRHRQNIEKRVPYLTIDERVEVQKEIERAMEWQADWCVINVRFLYDLHDSVLYEKPILNLRDEDFKAICAYVREHRDVCLRQAKEAGKSVYLSTRETGLARSLHFSPDGSIWMHCTRRKNKGDQSMGSGQYKNVMIAYELYTGEKRASIGIKSRAIYEQEKKIATMLQSHTGFLPSYDFMEYAAKNDGDAGQSVRKYRFLQALASGDLVDALNRSELSNIKDREDVTRQLVSGLALMHRQGIIHRDVKPDNILYAKDHAGKFLVYINDFDGCVQIGDREAASKYAGTPGYSAPEYGALVLQLQQLSRSKDETTEQELRKQLVSYTSPALDAWSLGRTLCDVWGVEPNALLRQQEKIPSSGPISVRAFLSALLAPDPRRRLLIEDAETLLSRVDFASSARAPSGSNQKCTIS